MIVTWLGFLSDNKNLCLVESDTTDPDEPALQYNILEKSRYGYVVVYLNCGNNRLLAYYKGLQVE